MMDVDDGMDETDVEPASKKSREAAPEREISPPQVTTAVVTVSNNGQLHVETTTAAVVNSIQSVTK